MRFFLLFAFLGIAAATDADFDTNSFIQQLLLFLLNFFLSLLPGTIAPPTTTTTPPTTTPPPVGTFQIASGMTIEGFDLYAYMNVPDLDNCLERCGWDERCSAVTFISAATECNLKEVGDPLLQGRRLQLEFDWESELSPLEGAESAYIAVGFAVPAAVPPQCNRDDYRVFIDQTPDASSSETMFGLSLEGCQSACAVTRGCTAFSLFTAEGDCELYTDDLIEDDFVASSEVMSGIPCPVVALPDGCPSSGFFVTLGIDLVGRDLFTAEAVDADECLQACIEVQSCTGFTFDDSNVCSLKEGEELFETVLDDGIVAAGLLCTIGGTPE